jgi:2,4-dienoyl-CoA reductase-like NADH-dependent reductase (Old Yellow Enzyme family)
VAFLFIRETEGEDSLLSHLKATFAGPIIANEEMDAADGRRLVEGGIADAVAFGRDYIATPDLAERIAAGAPLNEPDPATFYPQPGQDPSVGYTDYPVLIHH